MIDLGLAAARAIGADHHPVSLADLHAAYLRANPGISKGSTLDSFGATLNYHTINMRSRFPEPRNKQQFTSWLTRPLFKRVAYGQYMLLSPEDLAHFRRLVEAGDPRIYADEYDLGDLALAPVQMARVVPDLTKTSDGQRQGGTQRRNDDRMVGQRWNEQTFFARLAEICTPEGVQAARRLYSFAVQCGAEAKWNAGPYAGSSVNLMMNSVRLPAMGID